MADKIISFGSGTLANATGVKTSVATAVTQQTYTAGALNGALMAAGKFSCPRTITATLSSSAGAYTASSAITVTGTDTFGNVLTDTLTISGTGGGVTITGVVFMSFVTSIVVAAQANTAGALTFGVADAAVNAKQLRVGTAGNLTVKCSDPAGTVDTIYAVQIGEAVPLRAAVVYASSTAQGITAYV